MSCIHYMGVYMQQDDAQRRIAEKKAAAEERRGLEVQRRQREVCTHISL